MWKSGQVVVHQEVWKQRLWAARPLRVVEDTGERMVLWMPKGTMRKVPATPPSRPDPPDIHARTIENLDRGDWVLVDHEWDVSVLWIVRAGDWHSTWVSWLPDGRHYGWYVNLQRPMRRTAIGFEAMDLMLDIVVDPDLSWRWKDEDEFEELCQRGIFERALGERVRREALAVIADIERGAPPFSELWPAWRAHGSWPAPTLPEGWDRLPSW